MITPIHNTLLPFVANKLLSNYLATVFQFQPSTSIYMKKNVILYLIFLFAITFTVTAQNVLLKNENPSLQSSYAEKILEKSLLRNGYTIGKGDRDIQINLRIDSENMEIESFEILPEGNTVTITGGDGAGVIYGSLSLAEDLDNDISLKSISKKNETSKLKFRAIKFDLPWDTYRHSYALSQHQETCRDLKYWEAFLDMMCENRFNALTLWNLHPYTFLIKPKNFPEASPWSDEEMKEWKHLFGEIFRMAKERGIDTYIMPFNIFVTPEFAKAHNVEMFNLEHHHFVAADTSEIIKVYTRECVTQMLNEYPDLTGIGLTLGEGMGGMTPQERENWIRSTIIKGMSLADRKSKLIHRIPFSGNTASVGATSVELEQITRAGIEEEAAMDCFEAPVWASMKFNWSHPLSTTKLIKVHGGKLYGTYWNPEPKDYRIVWTARNEDFFCLRWGVADFIREHINVNTHSYVGGYFVGSETYIPAKDYFTKPDPSINWKYAFERQWLYYMLWGRLLFDPATSDDVFRSEFVRRYGKEASVLFDAFELAGKTPLRLASSFDCTWDFTLYSEGFMALNPETHRVDYISVDRQINQPPLDTDYVSIADYVKVLSDDKSFPKSKITPPVLAEMLEHDCMKALTLLDDFHPNKNTSVKYEIADVRTWANLGLFFAEKIRGALALQQYRVNGGEEYKENAIRHLEKALHYWDVVISITTPLYKDMPLTHLSEQDGKPWQENDHLRFHWRLLRDDVAEDVEIAKRAVVNPVE